VQVYFWIGSECSVDEQAVAAIKVEHIQTGGEHGVHYTLTVHGTLHGVHYTLEAAITHSA
jgi:hypothetical protein